MISETLAVLETEEQRNELADFYEKNKSKFYTIAFDHLHNQEVAEDAVQETFLRIADKPDEFFSLAGQKRIKYVYAIVRNVSTDMFNNSTNVSPEQISEKFVYQNGFDVLENSLFERISHKEIILFIRNLPELQRNVLILTCLSKLSVSETAQILRISKNVVYQRLHLARKAIKNYIEERSKNDD